LLNTKPETIIDIGDKWKAKHNVDDSSAKLNTYQRIFVPASNIERQPDEGCMKKIKIERSLKLRQEDLRNRNFNVLTNNQEPENNWINSFGG
jgi:arylamine N-acetyltransferase